LISAKPTAAPAASRAQDGPGALIIYDGACILCRNYARLVRLRETIGPVELIDARSQDPSVLSYWRDGHDLDQGMLFIHERRVHHGADAVHALALLSSRSIWFNRLNAAIFSNRATAIVLYPLLKLARRLSLLLFGRGRLLPPSGA
jgi:predicted DCC family thiol-disulfide oxidoreductase YuxK